MVLTTVAKSAARTNPSIVIVDSSAGTIGRGLRGGITATESDLAAGTAVGIAATPSVIGAAVDKGGESQSTNVHIRRQLAYQSPKPLPGQEYPPVPAHVPSGETLDPGDGVATAREEELTIEDGFADAPDV